MLDKGGDKNRLSGARQAGDAKPDVRAFGEFDKALRRGAGFLE